MVTFPDLFRLHNSLKRFGINNCLKLIHMDLYIKGKVFK